MHCSTIGLPMVEDCTMLATTEPVGLMVNCTMTRPCRFGFRVSSFS